MSESATTPRSGSRPPGGTGPSAGGIAFLGCGTAAAMHARTIARVQPSRALFFASRSGEKARRFSLRHGGAGAFTGYEAALRDERVAIAFVVTPPGSHRKWTLAALEAAKHVIVEKPAFLSSADFDAVEAAAREAGRQVLVAENYAYKPIVDELRWIFEEEPLGRVLFLNVDAVKSQRVEGWRTDPEHMGGGALLEGGIHWISLLAHLGPRVTSVRALEAGLGGEHEGGERSMQVLLRFDQGAVASLSYSWEVPSLLGGARMSRVYGTEGSAAFESNGAFFTTFGRPWRARLVTSDLLGYRAMFRDFLDAVASGLPPRYSLSDARRDVKLVEEAYRDAGLKPRRQLERGI